MFNFNFSICNLLVEYLLVCSVYLARAYFYSPLIITCAVLFIFGAHILGGPLIIAGAHLHSAFNYASY